MTDALSSGKGHREENFPVASWLIAKRHRIPVLAFYRVARLADDIADHPTAPADEKLARLAAIEATLKGEDQSVEPAAVLRQVMAERHLSPQHVLDLLTAFRRDVTQQRYADWGELMDYCRYSAAPVGRFVLEVHGEPSTTWPANDALCSALQVINHLQDCAKDYRNLGRVYVPEDALAAEGASIAALSADQASPALRATIGGLARRALSLLEAADPLAGQVRDRRLRLEIGVIQALAVDLAKRLTRRDPLSERVHHSRLEVAQRACLGAWRAITLAGGSANRMSGAIGDA
jgi:squalene synthase HpnC